METATERLTPRARAKRDQIRSAAQRLFLRQGFAATSTDAIAAEAGVSKQTLYAYYPSKEVLLTDVLRHLIEQLAQTHPVEAPSPLPLHSREELAAALTQFAHAIVTTLMQPDYLALVRVLLAETSRLPHLGQVFRQAVPEQVLRRVAAVLEQAQAQGLVRPLDTAAAAKLFVGPLLIDVLLNGLMHGGRPPQPSPSEQRQQIATLVDLYLRAIVA